MKEWVICEEDLGCDGAYLSYDEVIRCKGCKHYNGFFKECDLLMIDVTPKDFCSKAERKEE